MAKWSAEELETWLQWRRLAGRAHNLVKKAIREGALARLPNGVRCSDCEALATQYDHRDYHQPLDVEPICRRCNKLRGPADGVYPFNKRGLSTHTAKGVAFLPTRA
jgi:hypothetical protein